MVRLVFFRDPDVNDLYLVEVKQWSGSLAR
jgi:hypothetical protein